MGHEDMNPLTGWIDDQPFCDQRSQATGVSRTVVKAAEGTESYTKGILTPSSPVDEPVYQTDRSGHTLSK